MFSFLLLAGGNGSRLNKDMPKQFLMLSGKPIIMHTIERIEKIDEISEIIIVCHKEYIKFVKEYIKSYKLKKNYNIIEGGNTRQESVYKGLIKSQYNNIIIHESARPFVKIEEFKNIIYEPSSNAIYGIYIPFTVIEANDTITDLLDRNKLINVQLPQKFIRDDLLKAHNMAIEDKKTFTEDASLLYYYTKSNIKILKGTVYNLKITEPIDLLTSEIIYKQYILGRE